MRFAMIIVAGIAAMAPLTSWADELIYNYWEAAYVSVEPDALDQKLEGFGLGLSAELTKKVHVFGSYSEGSTSGDGEDVNVQSYVLGVGYAWPLMENLDLNGRVGYAGGQREEDGSKFNDDGYTVGISLRGRFVDRLELEGSVQYLDLSKAGDNTGFGISAQWYVTDQAAIGASWSYSDLGTGFTVGLRGTWGRTSQR